MDQHEERAKKFLKKKSFVQISDHDYYTDIIKRPPEYEGKVGGRSRFTDEVLDSSWSDMPYGPY